MKQTLFIILVFFFPVLLFSQQPDSVSTVKDTVKARIDTARAGADSAVVISDTIPVKTDSVETPAESYARQLGKILKENVFVNTSGLPIAMVSRERKASSEDKIFYVLLVLTALLAFFRFIYTRYFNTLFRVFFNTTLRQSQLTDQLLQAKQASFFFNLLFVITGGIYVYFLFRYYNWVPDDRALFTILACILGMVIIYFSKYVILKFTGWVTNYSEAANTYAFIIFLINKILGIMLIPFIVIIAFSDPVIKDSAILISLLFVSLMLLLRFFRSYGLLQHQIKVSRLHFFLYITGVEIIPLLLIYKGLVVLLSKNL